MRYIALLLCFLCPFVRAATNVCANCTEAEVNSKISASASGDTVLLPACTQTWGTRVSVTGKSIVLKGAGIGQTKITDNVPGGCFQANVSLANLVTILGIEFTALASHTSSGMLNFDGPTLASQGDQEAFRVGYCKFNWSAAVTRGIESVNCYGVIDHNVFSVTATSGSIQCISPFGSSDSNDGGYTPWTRPFALGTTNCVCIEDNSFTYTTAIAGTEDCIDAYGGARLIIRNNTFTNCSQGFHGTDSGNRRSAHSGEIYNNTYVNNSSAHLRAITIRGGSWVVYNNTYGGSGATWNGVTLMYYRACDDGVNHLDQSTWKTCNGSNYKLDSANLSSSGSRTCDTAGTVGFCTNDKETLGTFGAACSGGTYSRYFDGTGTGGYPGRDQPGITTGQVTEMIWVWNNGGEDAGIYDGNIHPPLGLANWLTAGRDYTNAPSAKPGYSTLAHPHPLVAAQDTGGGGTPPGTSPFFVATTGDDATGNGSITNPWRHAQFVINQMSPGDTAYFRGGKYDESDTPDMIGFRDVGTPTRLLGYPGEVVVINNTGGVGSGAASISSCTNWWWADMTLSNFNIGLAVDSKSAMGVLSNIHFVHIGNQALHIHNCYSNIVRDCEFEDTKNGGSNGEGVYCGLGVAGGEEAHHITIFSNYIHNVHDESVELKPWTHDCVVASNRIDASLSTQSTAEGAIEVDDDGNYNANPNHIIAANSVYGFTNYTYGIHLMTGCRAYNNVLWNPGGSVSIKCEETKADTWVREVYNNTVDAPVGQRIVVTSTQAILTNNIGDTSTGNIGLQSTFFINYAGHDYRLVGGTIAVNSAIDLSSIFTVDANGTSRPQEGSWDYGAYEYVPVVLLADQTLKITRRINLFR